MKLTAILVAFLSLSAFANTRLSTRIHDVISPNDVSDVFRVMVLKNGMVLKAEATNLEILDTINEAKETGAVVDFKVNDRNIVAAEIIYGTEAFEDTAVEKEITPRDLGYAATNLTSMNRASALFRSLETRSKPKSECYQRADFWTRQLKIYHGVNAKKALVFFTRKYISQYDYKWWFHIAPSVVVNGTDIVVDREFTNGPMNIQPWANLFVSNGAKCPIIKHYNEYAHNQHAQYCYVTLIPMYYYQPADVQRLDTQGVQKWGWVSWESKDAKKGFRRAARRAHRSL